MNIEEIAKKLFVDRNAYFSEEPNVNTIEELGDWFQKHFEASNLQVKKFIFHIQSRGEVSLESILRFAYDNGIIARFGGGKRGKFDEQLAMNIAIKLNINLRKTSERLKELKSIREVRDFLTESFEINKWQIERFLDETENGEQFSVYKLLAFAENEDLTLLPNSNLHINDPKDSVEKNNGRNDPVVLLPDLCEKVNLSLQYTAIQKIRKIFTSMGYHNTASLLSQNPSTFDESSTDIDVSISSWPDDPNNIGLVIRINTGSTVSIDDSIAEELADNSSILLQDGLEELDEDLKSAFENVYYGTCIVVNNKIIY